MKTTQPLPSDIARGDFKGFLDVPEALVSRWLGEPQVISERLVDGQAALAWVVLLPTPSGEEVRVTLAAHRGGKGCAIFSSHADGKGLIELAWSVEVERATDENPVASFASEMTNLFSEIDQRNGPQEAQFAKIAIHVGKLVEIVNLLIRAGPPSSPELRQRLMASAEEMADATMHGVAAIAGMADEDGQAPLPLMDIANSAMDRLRSIEAAAHRRMS